MAAKTKKQSTKNGSLHGRWTDEEHRLFLEAYARYKKDWRQIEKHIGTRNCSQIRSHAQKYFLRLEKEGSSSLKESAQLRECSRPNKDDSSLQHYINEGQNKKQFERMNSAAPVLEAHSARKKPLLSKIIKSDIAQLEQEMSHTQTLGHTPSQVDRTVTFRSSAKRRKTSDDHFKSNEKQEEFSSSVSFKATKNDLQKPQLQLNAAAESNIKKVGYSTDEVKVLALQGELLSLQKQRDQLCQKLLTSACSIPAFCIKLDQIGQKFSDNCLFARIYNQSKSILSISLSQSAAYGFKKFVFNFLHILI